MVNLNTGAQYGKQDEEAYFQIRIKNPTPFVCLNLKLKLSISNTFFKTTGERVLEVPLYAFKGYTLDFPVIAKLPGIVSVTVDTVKVSDIMGFFVLKKKLDAKGELAIVPTSLDDMVMDLSNFESGMLESEESTKRGNDFSDVHDIREYIPGDKLMSIHWKLSAKRDILMVKDRVSMSDRQLVILPELNGSDINMLNQTIVITYSIITRLIKDNTTVRLMYWNNAGYEYVDTRLDYLEDVNQAFVKMFYLDTYNVYDEAASHMPNVHPELKSYVHVFSDGGRVNVMIRENG